MPGYDDVTILVNGVDVCGQLADRALALQEMADEALGEIPENRLSNTEDRRRLIRVTHLLDAAVDTTRSLWAAIAELGGRLRDARDRELGKGERLEPSEAETLGGRRRRPLPGVPVPVGAAAEPSAERPSSAPAAEPGEVGAA